MTTKTTPATLRHYTHLPALLYLLRTKQLTLLDPSRWQDTNDSEFVRLYAQVMQQTTLRAICFSLQAETYHHWSVFAPGPSGVCIEFNRAALCAEAHQHGLIHREVEYRLLPAHDGTPPPKVDDLPFLKRRAYDDEQEYRFLHASCSGSLEPFRFCIPLTTIQAIHFNPWMPREIADELHRMILAIVRPHHLKVAPSTLTSNDRWKSWGRSVLGPGTKTSTT